MPSAPTSELCAQCGKPPALCVCDRIARQHARTEVLILQHPQEPDKLLGSAHLTELALDSAHVRVGLSWASLSHALGRDAEYKDWAVLYLGSLKTDLSPTQLAKPVLVLDRMGNERDAKRNPLKGIVVLDGTWSQAKTLWWRNPWMLKLNRLLLHPKEPSAYGRLRKEPRRECLSTIESVAEAIEGLEGNAEAKKALRSLFRTLTQRARDAFKADELAVREPAEEADGEPSAADEVGDAVEAVAAVAAPAVKRGAVRKGGGRRGGARKGPRKSGGSRGGGPLD